MSNSVHLQWIKPALRALVDPTIPSLPKMTPLQVTESVNGVDFAPHLSVRFLLSDKVHKIWSTVTRDAMERLQREFPEFEEVENIHKMNGSIILPTRYQLQFHPNQQEFILRIDEFDYKGGAGNNEFSEPIFHAQEREIQEIIVRQRNIDVLTWMEKDALLNPPPVSAAAAVGPQSSHIPFTASVRDRIQQMQRDTRNFDMELDAYVSPDQLHQLHALDSGFRRPTPPRPAPAAAAVASSSSSAVAPKPVATADEYSSAYFTPSQLAPFSFSQLDAYCAGGGQGGASQWNYTGSQDDASQVNEWVGEREAFSQHRAPPPPAAAQSVPIPASSSSVATPIPVTPAPIFSSTHLFLSNHARAEKAAASIGSLTTKQPSPANQAFVAAFSHTIPAPLTARVTQSAPAPAAVALAPSIQTHAASSGPAVVPPTVVSSPHVPILPPILRAPLTPTKSFLPPASLPRASLSPVNSPVRPSIPTRSQDASPARSTRGSLPVSPGARTSQQHGVSSEEVPVHPPSLDSDAFMVDADAEQEPGAAGTLHQGFGSPASQRSHRSTHTGGRQSSDGDDLMDGSSTQDSDQRARIAIQQSQFPFLTQVGSEDEIDEPEDVDMAEEGSRPEEEAIANTPGATGVKGNGTATTSRSPSSLLIPPTPTPNSSADPTPPSTIGAVAPPLVHSPSVAFTTTSIEQRQAERRRLAAERIEAIEAQSRAEEAAKELARQQERQRLEEERRKKESMDQAQCEEQRRHAEMEAARRADEEAMAQIAARTTSAAASAAAATAASRTIADPFTQAPETMSDEDVCILAAKLTDSPAQNRKRPRETEEHKATIRPIPMSHSSIAALSAPKRHRGVALVPVVEDAVRKAMNAVDAAHGGNTRARQRLGTRIPPLPLSFGTTIATDKAPNKSAVDATSATSHLLPAASSVVPVPEKTTTSAFSGSTSTTGHLPPFGTILPITSNQVEAAIRYFRETKRSNAIRQRQQPSERQSNSTHADRDDDVEEESKDGSAPQDQLYSQWY